MLRQQRIAYCPKCHKRTAWLYINGVETFWLCLLCATRQAAWRRTAPSKGLPR
jgi:hypothetical protein